MYLDSWILYVYILQTLTSFIQSFIGFLTSFRKSQEFFTSDPFYFSKSYVDLFCASHQREINFLSLDI